MSRNLLDGHTCVWVHVLQITPASIDQHTGQTGYVLGMNVRGRTAALVPQSVMTRAPSLLQVWSKLALQFLCSPADRQTNHKTRVKTIPPWLGIYILERCLYVQILKASSSTTNIISILSSPLFHCWFFFLSVALTIQAFCETLEESNYRLQKELLEKQKDITSLKRTLEEREQAILLLEKHIKSAHTFCTYNGNTWHTWHENITLCC